ncbi:MAG: peptidylprolyl isomerase [Kofleriaceae bacterium]
MRSLARLFIACALATTACGGAASPPPALAPATPAPARSPVVSWDLLAQEPVANEARVKHILIGWKDLADAFRGNLDPRAEARTQADAEDTVREILAALDAGADFDATMLERSEDLSSARSGAPIVVTPDAGLVIEFRMMSLRLEPGQLGVCQSDFGFHIIKRVD